MAGLNICGRTSYLAKGPNYYQSREPIALALKFSFYGLSGPLDHEHLGPEEGRTPRHWGGNSQYAGDAAREENKAAPQKHLTSGH